LDTPLIERKVLHSLNGLLPEDIRIISLEETDPSFHARYSATGKIYHYHLHLRPVLNPFTRLYSFQVPFQIDLALMQQATSYFLGTKDFSSFANEPHLGAAAKNGVRTMKRLDIIEEQDGVCLAFEADGFLYKMVRNITGTLLDVAAGKIPLSHLPDIFAAKDRKRAGRAAPPQGLFLMRVYYS
jgi:tRNA pseudouridine38-40 synthase